MTGIRRSPRPADGVTDSGALTPDPVTPEGPVRLGPEEKAFLARLRIELALATAALAGAAFFRSPAAGLTALLTAGVMILNFYGMAAGLKVVIFDATRRKAARGVLSFLGRFLLLGALFFAIIRGSWLDKTGFALGCMTVVAAIFLEVFYLLGREVKTRWNTRRL